MADTFVKTKKKLSAYCGRTFKFGGDIRITIDTLEAPTFFKRDDLPPTATAGQMMLWGDAGRLRVSTKMSRSYMPLCGVNAPT